MCSLVADAKALDCAAVNGQTLFIAGSEGAAGGLHKDL